MLWGGILDKEDELDYIQLPSCANCCIRADSSMIKLAVHAAILNTIYNKDKNF